MNVYLESKPPPLTAPQVADEVVRLLSTLSGSGTAIGPRRRMVGVVLAPVALGEGMGLEILNSRQVRRRERNRRYRAKVKAAAQGQSQSQTKAAAHAQEAGGEGISKRLQASPSVSATTPPLSPAPGLILYEEAFVKVKDGQKLEVCRGLAWIHMNGKNETEKKINFYGLKHGEYPPNPWCIPTTVRGAELLRLIKERSALSKQKDGHRRCREAEAARVQAQTRSDAT